MQARTGGILLGFFASIFGIGACGHDAFQAGRACVAGSSQACYTGPAGTKGVGPCTGGQQECLPDESAWGPCVGEVTPKPETCATFEDDDCDGKSNEEGEGCACVPGAMEACYIGPKATEGVGLCAAGMHVCGLDGAWGLCAGEVLPEETEDCASPGDENCDGVVCADPLWGELFGNADAQTVGAIVSDAEGNAILVGGFAGAIDFGGGPLFSGGVSDAYVVKLDAKGKKIWAVGFGGTGPDEAEAAVVDAHGDVLIAGSFASKGVMVGGLALGDATDFDAFVVKLDGATGQALWAQKIGETGNDDATSIAVDAAGDVYVGGWFSDILYCPPFPPCVGTNGGLDGFVVRVTSGGDVVWRKTFGGPSTDRVDAVATDGAGNVVVAGTYSGTAKWGNNTLMTTGPNDQNFFVAKLAPTGAPIWAQGYGDAAMQEANGVAVRAGGDVVVTGHTAGVVAFGNTDFGGGADRAFVAQLSAGGAPGWGRAFASMAGPAGGSSVSLDAAGNIGLAGRFGTTIDFGDGVVTATGITDAFLAKLGADGGTLWAKTFGAKGVSNIGQSVAFTPSGDVLFAATVRGTIDFGLGNLTSAGNVDVGAAAFSP